MIYGIGLNTKYMSRLFQYNGKTWEQIGKDGKTPTVAELQAIIKPLIPPPAENGKTPVKGVDYFDGKDGSPDQPDEIVAKINKSTKIIDAERIRGLVKAFELLDKYGTNPTGVSIGGGKNIRFLTSGTEISQHVTEINFSTGITATYANNGRITLTASGGGGGATIETPTGSVNASNTSFTVSAEPQYVVSDGITYFDGAGYTYSALTVTMTVPPSQYIRAFI